MKKVIALLLIAVICLSAAACGAPKIEEVSASDGEKQLVIDAAKKALSTEEFKSYVEEFETKTGKKARTPEIAIALTFKFDDVNGYALDLVLFNVKCDVAVGDGFNDAVQFIVDNETGEVYDSATYREACANYRGEINSKQDAIIGFLNSGVLSNGQNDYLWSEMEESTRFTAADLKEINKAINQ